MALGLRFAGDPGAFFRWSRQDQINVMALVALEADEAAEARESARAARAGRR